ncbi:hypothetical protein FRC03_012685 [Tulasnella sp. 419]|nr:hypothetical protein FRC03_012685 [Tulasnella sp. 419]
MAIQDHQEIDVEKHIPPKDSASSKSSSDQGNFGGKFERVVKWGVETRGIHPVSLEERTDPHLWKAFFIWLSANCNILSFSAGTLGPLIFGLGFRDSALVIAGFNLLCCHLPAYFSTFGPKLGLRQMVQARYSWGYYLVAIPAAFNLVTMMGFMILNCILGGETLSSVSEGRLSWNVGIVVIALISLFVSFCGYRVLNWFVWVVIRGVFIILTSQTGMKGWLGYQSSSFLLLR